MSLFEQASIFVTPNAVKAGKLYTLKPEFDTSGALPVAYSLDVVRATNATRVDSNSLVEIPRTNLALQSQTFDNASWNKANVTVLANVTVTDAPDGTLTAEKLIENATNTQHFINQGINVVAGITYTQSIFVKSAERFRFRLEFPTGQFATNDRIVFDLSNGTFSGVAGSPTMTQLSDGWWRITISSTCTTSGVSNFVPMIMPNSGTSTIYLGDGTSGIFIWGAQYQTGNVATEYIPTTTSIRTRFADITQDGASASNIPRLDYTNGSCPSILVEPQRTNLLLRSEEFNNAFWLKEGGSINANVTTSPDGTSNADKLIETAVSILHGFRNDTGILISGTHTFSIYLKRDERRYVNLSYNTVGQNYTTGLVVDLDNGNITQVFGSGFASTPTSLSVSNGWYRVSFTATFSGTSFVYVNGAISGTPLTSSGRASYTGVVGEGYFIWGAQLEAGSNATSYIPTVASAVTRNADVISKTGISDLINSVEGCFYVEASSFINGGNFRQFSLSNGTDNSRLTMGWSSVTSRLLARLDIGGTNIVNSDIFSFNQTSNNKVLFKWGSGNFKVFINGVERLNLTSLTMPTANLFTKLGFDRGSSAGFFEGNVKEVIVFPTQLTDQECINLTTL